MEFEIMCDKCKGKYYIRPNSNIQTVVSLEETELKDGKEIMSRCPYCNGINGTELKDEEKKWYILYTTRVNSCETRSETEKANEILENIKITEEKNDIIDLVKKLDEIKIFGVRANNVNGYIKKEDFIEAVEEIANMDKSREIIKK